MAPVVSSNAECAHNKRVIIGRGMKRRKFILIDLDKVIESEVTLNALNRHYRVGTIRFFSGEYHKGRGSKNRVYDYWHAIGDPHAVYRLLSRQIDNLKEE